MGDTTGILYLLPNTLGKTPENNTIPDYVLRIVRSLEYLVVENTQSAVRYLQWVGDTPPEYKIRFRVLNKKTPAHEIASFLEPLLRGEDAGLLSEAGMPAVADPGSELVRMAHGRGITVRPLAGPSSIFLALAASGFNGQQFAFHGYLPIDRDRRRSTLRNLERRAQKEHATQIFMEAPHRNDAIVEDVLELCAGDTRFCTATNLTLPDEKIISASVRSWRERERESIHKEPTIFLLASPSS